MRSWEAVQLLEQGKREQREAEGGCTCRASMANRASSSGCRSESVDDNPTMPPTVQAAYRVDQRDDAAHADPPGHAGRAVAVEPARARVRRRRCDTITPTKRSARGAGRGRSWRCATCRRPVQEQLDEILHPPPPNVGELDAVLRGCTRAIVALPFVADVRRLPQATSASTAIARAKSARRCSSPRRGSSASSCFVGGPILFSIVFSFTRYDVLSPARYVGVEQLPRSRCAIRSSTPACSTPRTW